MGTNLIDCDANPSEACLLHVIKHQKEGRWNWDHSEVQLYQDEVQIHGLGQLPGNELRCKLPKEVLNANVLDYLLVHPELIPEEWKDKCVFFWGTIYESGTGRLFVRFLHWYVSPYYWEDQKGKWLSNDHWLYNAIGSNDFAAVLHAA